LFGELLKCFRSGTGDRFGEFEVFVVFGLAEVLGAEQFLGADDLSALFGGALGCSEGFLEIGSGVGGASGLDQANGNFG
jgi:hypothetical protein